jgi:hypothetical protein
MLMAAVVAALIAALMAALIAVTKVKFSLFTK